MAAPALARFFDEYSGYHRTTGNRACHYAGIPLIVFSLLGLLSQIVIAGVGLYRLDGGLILWGVGAGWYVWHDWRLGGAFSVFLLGIAVAARPVPVPVDWVCFVLGWILQGVGHYRFEHRSPAFYKNFEHLLVGPIWIFAKLFA